MNDDLLNDFLLEAFPNPERKGCPDDKVLKALAENRLPAGHPALQHVASCSECYAEYRHYRLDWKEASSKAAHGATLAQLSEPQAVSTPNGPVVAPASARSRTLSWAVAAGLLIALGGGVLLVDKHHAPPPSGAVTVASSGPVNANVDLFNAVTVRGSGGDEPALQELTLPSSVVHLTVTLPRFSERGAYEIIVAKDRGGKAVVARGLGNGVDVDGKVSLIVTLDLRNAAPGMYFLGTVRGSDNGTYYYPLKVS